VSRVCGVTRVSAFVVAGAMLVGLPGCESDASSTNNTKPAATTAAATVPKELVGVWVAKIGPRPRGSVSEYPPGRYEMRILADGTVEMYLPDANPKEPCIEQMYCSTWSVKADEPGRLQISATPDCTKPAGYAYRVKGAKLTTKLVRDDCSGERPRVYNGGVVWTHRGG
jgi:hypothetical protein